MFGRRSDGKKIKNIEPFQKIIPHIMKTRSDSQNTFTHYTDCAVLDEFIARNREENGVSISYFHIVIAAMVRLLAERPQINRFVMNGRIYRRNDIQISFAVKKALRDDAVGTTIKLTFRGDENIYEVKRAVDEAIVENATLKSNNDTDKTAKVLTNMPNAFIKMGVGLIKFLDKHGMCSKKVLKASPFHTSCFITNMKSIKTDFIYHHLYDFGTTGIFIAIGKEELKPVAERDGSITARKLMGIGIVTDERFCDGFYYANSLRKLRSYLENPSVLEQNLDHIISDVE